jgi:hypothetical protein
MAKKRLWAYIARLEKVIKATMEGSDEIADLVAKINNEGVDISINCIALFSDRSGRALTGEGRPEKKPRSGIRKKRTKPGGPAAAAGKGTKAGGRKEHPRVSFEVTPEDHEFLKGIGIKYD